MNRKVCHISYNHDPFDDRIYWKELITLNGAGYDVVHICVGDLDKDYISNEGVRIIQIKRVHSRQNIWIRRFEHFFLRNKNETIEAILSKSIDINADVYHYHDIQINAIVKKLKKLKHKPKVIYDCHEAYHLLFVNNKAKNAFYSFIRKIVVYQISRWELASAKRCDFIIVNYIYVLNYFKNKAPNVPSTIIYNYSLLKNTQLINKEIENKKYDFIYAGSINRLRGINEILMSLSHIKGNNRDIKLILIGSFEESEYLDEVSSLIKKLDLVDNVIIHPPVPFNEINKYYQQSKIGLCILHQTSIFKEALPIKLFEYMSNGLPVIFANHGPSVEIIQESKCGLLVNEKDEMSISKAMMTLLHSKSFYKSCSINGIHFSKTKYNWNIEKEKLLKVYQDVLK